MERFAATIVSAWEGRLGVVIQLVTAPVLCAGEDFIAAGKLAGMDSFALLCLADAMGGGGVCDGEGNVSHGVCSAHCARRRRRR